MTAHDTFPLLIDAVTPVAEGVVSLLLTDPAGGSLPGWEPGAHIDLCLGPDLVRQYSLCGTPGGSSWRVAVLREPDGRGGSAFVHDTLKAGGTVTVAGPRNHFPLVPAVDYLFVAGGIGITPLLPMIASVTHTEATWRLLYGGRSRASMAFLPELPAVDTVSVRPQDEFGLLDLQSALAGATARTAVYCCGPEPLIAAVEKACAARGLPEPHVERFAAKPVDDTEVDRAFSVVLRRSGDRYDIPVGKSILEVLEAGGVAVDSSCTEGVCGTCETVVLEGAVVHRDSLLTEAERAAGTHMMICVSRAASDVLVLDL